MLDDKILIEMAKKHVQNDEVEKQIFENDELKKAFSKYMELRQQLVDDRGLFFFTIDKVNKRGIFNESRLIV